MTTADHLWPHAPPHHLSEAGAYMVTAGTYQRAHHFRAPERLDVLERGLLTVARDHGWNSEAWAVFSNHYHFVAQSAAEPENLSAMLSTLHRKTALWINKLDATPNRKVWFNYFETHLTYERSYLTRLSYVHQNAVKHGLVPVATQYRWCSARWLESTTDSAFRRTLDRLKIDRVNVLDEFTPLSPEATA